MDHLELSAHVLSDLIAQEHVDAHNLVLAVLKDMELEGGIVGGGA